MTKSTDLGKQNVICVLGMHRSGTSLLARMLNLMGVSLGPEQSLMQPTRDNPKGYWEHDEIVGINDEILRRLGGSWEEPPTLSPGWENDPILDDLKERSRTLIQESFANVENWGWKDPRTCLTLRFWQQLLPEMRYVICLRNPVDVAYSLQRRDGFSGEKSSGLWLTYVTSALQQSEGKPRLIVFYEDLLDDCFGQLKRLADFMGKPVLAKQRKKEAVQDFLEKGLEHSRTSMVQAAASPIIDPRTKALYLAHRISVSLRRKESNSEEELDRQIAEAMDILSQSSFKPSVQTNQIVEQLAQLEILLAESGDTIRTLPTRLSEQDKILEANSVRLAENEQTLRLLSTQLVEKDAMIGTLSSQLVEKDAMIGTLSSQLVEKDSMIGTQSSQLVEKDAMIGTQSSQLVEKDAMIGTLSTQLIEKDGIVDKLSTQLVEKDATVDTLSTQLVEKDASVGTLSAQLVEKDRIVDELSIQLNEKAAIVDTLSTKLLEKDTNVDTLSTKLLEKNAIIGKLSTQLTNQDLYQRSQTERLEETIAVVSAQLCNTQTELKNVTDTLGWRVLKRYGRVKYGYLLPVYRLLGKKT